MSAAWIDQADILPRYADHDPVGLDTEFMRRDTFYPKLALVQVAHAPEQWLIDPLAYDAGADVRGLVARRRCIMHSASEDLEALAPLIGDAPMELFDTQVAAALCGMGQGLSYQRLVATLLGVEVAKHETRSDWLQRPLTTSQVDYAGQDVAYLAPLHDKLSRELQRLGRAGWHAEDCARMVQRAQYNRTQVDPQPQRAFAAASDWPPPAQARLKRVLHWREDSARKLDRPRPWLLDDAHALALSQRPPQSQQELFERVRGQRALRGPQRAQLFGLLRASATPEELQDLAPIPPAPKGEAQRAVEAMRAAVNTAAARLDLPPGVLCPRRLLEQLAVTRAWPADLAGWRRGELEPALTALLPG